MSVRAGDIHTPPLMVGMGDRFNFLQPRELVANNDWQRGILFFSLI